MARLNENLASALSKQVDLYSAVIVKNL